MNWRLGFVLLLLAYALVVSPFSQYLKDRPVEVKLGYLPHPQLLKIASGEHRSTTAAFIVMRVLFYYGTILQQMQQDNPVQPEFQNMYRMLLGVVDLDPYNMDAYYFSQAAFTWELGRIREVNHMLKQGMKYRAWDYWLPFYIGFNYGYFLKDYKNAAFYMQRAAEISGKPIFVQLASRYLYESEQSAFGLVFLDKMIREAKNPAMRRSYQMRYEALQAVLALEKAVNTYRDCFNKFPESLDKLVTLGLLSAIPADPYGGVFYLDEQGKVRSSSKFAGTEPETR